MRQIKRISGAVSELQLRELMAELAYVNLHIKERPAYRSIVDNVDDRHRIVADLPQFELTGLDKNVRGRLMHHALKHAIPHIKVPGVEHGRFVAALEAGDWTFLFDKDGNFIS